LNEQRSEECDAARGERYRLYVEGDITMSTRRRTDIRLMPRLMLVTIMSMSCYARLIADIAATNTDGCRLRSPRDSGCAQTRDVERAAMPRAAKTQWRNDAQRDLF